MTDPAQNRLPNARDAQQPCALEEAPIPLAVVAVRDHRDLLGGSSIMSWVLQLWTES